MILFDKQLNVFHLSNDQISYLIQIEEGGNVAHLYFGKKSLIILAAIVIHVLIGPFRPIPQTAATDFSH
jgi:branched-subunit amino acid permease